MEPFDSERLFETLNPFIFMLFQF